MEIIAWKEVLVIMIKVGDKIIAKENGFGILPKGSVGEVTEVVKNGDAVFVKFEGFEFSWFIETNLIYDSFVVVPEARWDVPAIEDVDTEYVLFDDVSEILNKSDIEMFTAFDSCTVVVCKLPNGFFIVESYACVNPADYDEEIGVSVCFDKIREQIRKKLEAYELPDYLNGNLQCGKGDAKFWNPYEEYCDDEYDDFCDGIDCNNCVYLEDCGGVSGEPEVPCGLSYDLADVCNKPNFCGRYYDCSFCSFGDN